MYDIDTNIKIAVVGCGSMGRKNIRAFAALDDVEITACCDTDEEIAGFTAREFGIPVSYGNLAEMLDETPADALIVAVPDGGHIETVLEALNGGLHVFCESPLASNYAEAVEMTRAARDSGLTAMVNFSRRNEPVIASALKYIDSGRLGKVRYFEASYMQNRLDSRLIDDPSEEKRLLWRLSSAAGSAGALGELGSALYDIAVRVCGGLEYVSTMIKNIAAFDQIEEYRELELTAGDTFISQLGFENGAAGLVRGSWTAGGPHEQLTLNVYGDNGSILLDTEASESTFTVYTAGGVEKVDAEPAGGESLQENFIASLKGEALPQSGFDHALKIQYFIEQSVLSHEGGLRMYMEQEREG
jgi:predicted dehydrogenase